MLPLNRRAAPRQRRALSRARGRSTGQRSSPAFSQTIVLRQLSGHRRVRRSRFRPKASRQRGADSAEPLEWLRLVDTGAFARRRAHVPELWEGKTRGGMGRQNKKRAGNGSRRAKKKCGSEWSISRVLFPPSSSRTSGAVNIPLGSRLLCTSSEPTRRRSAGHRMDAVCCAPVPPYLLLLQMGFAVPVTSLPPRCALTAPFHPCLASPKVGRGRFVFCGTFRRVAPPGR